MPAETADASTHAIFSADDLKRLRRAPRSQSRRHNRFGRISRRRARRSFFFRRAHRLLWCMGGLRAPRGHQVMLCVTHKDTAPVVAHRPAR